VQSPSMVAVPIAVDVMPDAVEVAAGSSRRRRILALAATVSPSIVLARHTERAVAAASHLTAG